MLFKQTIMSDEVNEIQQKGRYIKIVHCTGDLRITVVKGGEKLIDTTAKNNFEFAGVDFDYLWITSDIPQTYQIWASMYRLGYNPLQSTVVGSTGLLSESRKVFFGEPREIVPAVSGRKAVTLNSPKDIWIGAIGVDASSAIKLPANTPFKLETQAALYGYSGDEADQLRQITDLSDGISKVHSVSKSGPKYGIYYNEVLGYSYAIGHTGLKYAIYRVSDLDLSFSGELTKLARAEHVVLSSGNLLAVGEDQRSVVEVNGNSFSQSIVETVPFYITRFAANARGMWFACDWDFLELRIFDGEKVATLTPPEVTKVMHAQFIGDRILLFGTTASAYSDDFGQTWIVRALPENLEPSNFVNNCVVVDVQTEQILYCSATGVYRSNNRGETWTKIYESSTAGTPRGIASLGGYIAIATTRKIIYETPSGLGVFDNGGNWFATGTMCSLNFTNTGHIVMGENDWSFFSSGKTQLVGGVSISVLSEIN